jgi:hypothetical protein
MRSDKIMIFQHFVILPAGWEIFKSDALLYVM